MVGGSAGQWGGGGHVTRDCVGAHFGVHLGQLGGCGVGQRGGKGGCVGGHSWGGGSAGHLMGGGHTGTGGHVMGAPGGAFSWTSGHLGIGGAGQGGKGALVWITESEVGDEGGVDGEVVGAGGGVVAGVVGLGGAGVVGAVVGGRGRSPRGTPAPPFKPNRKQASERQTQRSHQALDTQAGAGAERRGDVLAVEQKGEGGGGGVVEAHAPKGEEEVGRAVDKYRLGDWANKRRITYGRLKMEISTRGPAPEVRIALGTRGARL